MKNALLIHGMPDEAEHRDPNVGAQSNLHWTPWVQRQLILKGYLAQALEFPRPYDPVYEEWLEVVKNFSVSEDSVLIGHSGGAGFILRWIAESKQKVGHIILVAPWVDPEKELTTGFFDFQIDAEIKDYAEKISIIYSKDDDQQILDSVKIITEAVQISETKAYEDKGHFTESSMGSKEFPELLELI